jgi:hypothetical protein
MRAKVKDIRQGRTLWMVNCYLKNPQHRRSATVQRIECLDTPKPSKYRSWQKKVLFANFRYQGTVWSGPIDIHHSLRDHNIVWNDYNQHMVFTKQKAAEAYADRIRSGCYNAQELAFMRKCDRITNIVL